MTVERGLHANNILVGAGEIWIDRYVPDPSNPGTLIPSEGERYLGDSVAAAISLETETSTVDSGDGAVPRVLATTLSSVSRTFTFTLHDASVENIGLYLLDDGAPATDPDPAADPVDWATPTAVKDRWYQIGASATMPGGVGALSEGDTDTHGTIKVRVLAPPSTTDADETAAKASGRTVLQEALIRTADLGNMGQEIDLWEAFRTNIDGSSRSGFMEDEEELLTDENYRIDVRAGRIQVRAAGMHLIVRYRAAGARQRTRVGAESRRVECALRYIEDPKTGTGRNIYIRRANLAPGGEAVLKSADGDSEEQRYEFTAEIVDAPPYPLIAIDGDAVTL